MGGGVEGAILELGFKGKTKAQPPLLRSRGIVKLVLKGSPASGSIQEGQGARVTCKLLCCL